MAFEDNLQKPVLSEATLHYRRNLFLLLSVASFAWLYGDLVDYSKLSPLKSDAGGEVIREVALYTLLSGFLFNGAIYYAYAEREIREWQNGVVGPVSLKEEKRLHLYRMYFADGPISENAGPNPGDGTREYTREIEGPSGKRRWYVTAISNDGTRGKKSAHKPDFPEMREAVQSRHWVDIVWLGRAIPYGSFLIGSLFVFMMLAGWSAPKLIELF